MDTDSELKLIPEDPKHHCGPPGRVAIYGGQVINGVVGQVHLTVGPVGPQTHLVFVSPISNA